MEEQRELMLAKVSGFRPQETVFEVGKRGQVDETVETIKRRRRKIEAKKMGRDADALEEFQDSLLNATTDVLNAQSEILESEYAEFRMSHGCFVEHLHVL